MDAMILAAGAGTRLRPLTDRIPKALVPVRGRPLLAHVLDRLTAAGATRVIVNTHHHGDQIGRYLAAHAPGGVEIVLSPEPGGPYDTGGGLLAAAPHFERSGPFFLHNVDIVSAIPLDALYAAHTAAAERRPGRLVASLAVRDRDGGRRLLFDADGLMGWENRGPDGAVVESHRVREPRGPAAAWGFTGIHVIDPLIFDHVGRRGTFSIIGWYLDLARDGWPIQPVDVSSHEWIDVGTPDRLAEADGPAA